MEQIKLDVQEVGNKEEIKEEVLNLENEVIEVVEVQEANKEEVKEEEKEEVKEEAKKPKTKKEKAKKEEVKEEEKPKTKEELKEEKRKEEEEKKRKIQEEKAKQKALIDELKAKLIEEIQNKNKDFKENVTIHPTTKYVGVRYKNKIVAELEQVGRGLIVRVLDIYGSEMEGEENQYVIKEGVNDLLIKKCPLRFKWRVNTELLLQNKKQYKQVFEALKMSVDLQKKEFDDKLKKAKEETKKEEK